MMRKGLLFVLVLFLLPVFPVQAQATAPDIASYSIDVRLDPQARTLEARETVTYRNSTNAPIPDLVFHLYLNAFKDETTIFMSESGSQHRGNVADANNRGWIEVNELRLEDGTELDLELLEDGTLARAVLPQPVEPGESITFHAAFTARLPKVFARTGWALDDDGDLFFMVGQWFPKLGVWQGETGWNAYPFHANSEFFADFGTYEVAITLPEAYVTGASGLPAGTQANGDGTRTDRYRAEDVIDFAWTASPNFRSTAREVNGTELLYLYLPAAAWTIDRAMDAAEQTLIHYADWYGPYPYPRLTLVDAPVPGAGGMEYPTLVTLGAEDITGTGLPFNKLGMERWIEIVTVHEVSHQWWQSMVATNEAEEPWLDEGLADFSTMRMMEVLFPNRPSAIDLPGLQASYLDMRRSEYIASPEVSMYGRAWEFPGFSYAIATYSKPALSLMTLKNVIGEERMNRMMRAYFTRYQYGQPTTEDFRAVAEEALGEDIAWFWDGMVYGSGTLNYSARAVDQYSITAARDGELAIPVEIEVTFADGERTRVAWDGAQPQQEFTFDQPVRAFQVDPDRDILVDLVWSDNGLARQADIPAWLGSVTRLLYRMQDWLLAMGGL